MINFVVTNYGKNILSQGDADNLPTTLTFVLGSGGGYGPLATENDIRGTQVLSGSTEPLSLVNGYPEYTIRFSANLLNSSFGEIGLFFGQNLVMLGSSDRPFTPTDGLVSLSVLLQDGFVGDIKVLDQKALKILASVDQLPVARLANPNLVSIEGSSQLAVADPKTNTWTLVGGIDLGTRPLSTGSTQNNLLVNLPSSLSPGDQVILSFQDGPNVGFVRGAVVANNSGNTLSFYLDSPLLFPVNQDVVKVYSPALDQRTVRLLQQSRQLLGATIEESTIGLSNPSSARFTEIEAYTLTVAEGIIASNLDSTPIGRTVPAEATVTNLNVTGNLNLAGFAQVLGNLRVVGTTTLPTLVVTNLNTANATITGGNIDGAVIGFINPGFGKFSVLETESLTVTGNNTQLAGTLTTDNLVAPVAQIANLTASSGLLNGVVIGNTTAAAATFTGVTSQNSNTQFLSVTNLLTANSVTAQNLTCANLLVTQGSINGAVIGLNQPAGGFFTTLSATGTSNLGLVSAQGIEDTPIGSATPSTGAFSELTVSGNTTLGLDGSSSVRLNAGSLLLENNLSFNGGLLFLDIAAGRIGVNNSAPDYEFSIDGDFQFSSSASATIRNFNGDSLLSSVAQTQETRLTNPYSSGALILATGAGNGLEHARVTGNSFFKAAPTAQYLAGNNTPYHEFSSVNLTGSTLVVSVTGSPFDGALFKTVVNGIAPNGLHYEARTEGFQVATIAGNGDMLNVNNSYGALSDRKLKEDLAAYDKNVSEKLCELQLKTYRLKGQQKELLGLIADEVSQVFPSIVKGYTNNGESYDTVAYSVLNLLVLKGFQEHNREIRRLDQEMLSNFKQLHEELASLKETVRNLMQ